MTDKHTATPWFIQKENGTIKIKSVSQDSGNPRPSKKTACYINYKSNEKQSDIDAAYIVKCVNTHAELVEALEGMIEYSNMCERWQDREGRVYVKNAVAALKKATNEA